MDLNIDLKTVEGMTALLVFATFGLVAVTALLAWATFSLVSEGRRTRIAQSAPEVVVGLFAPYSTIVALRIENIGRGTAIDVHVTSNRELVVDFGGNQPRRSLAGSKFFDPPTLMPGQKLELWLGKFDLLASAPYTFDVTFQDIDRRKYVRTYDADLAVLNGTQLEKQHLEKISKHLEEIRDVFQRVSGGFSRLKVDSFSSSDRMAEDAEHQERMAEMKAALSDDV